MRGPLCPEVGLLFTLAYRYKKNLEITIFRANGSTKDFFLQKYRIITFFIVKTT